MSGHANTFEDIYRRFEDRFRGSREEIKQRLNVYLPLLDCVASDLRTTGPAFDLGCGRGEWLELLSEHGWRVTGVDLNAGMAKVATDLKLSVRAMDAIEFLRSQPDASASVVSAFHLVEHVPIEYLIDLLSECCRVLAETGLLILETPNPENLIVGTWSFHMDPTHNKPLPPLLLEFLVQNTGFEDTAIVRLNGSDPKAEEGPLERVAGIIFKAGMDYSVVAQKHAPGMKISQSKVQSFAGTVSQNNPADTFKVAELLKAADRQVNELILEAEGHSLRYSDLQNAIADIKNETTSLSKTMEVNQAALEFSLKNEMISHSKALETLHVSISWRITAPIRGTKRLLVWLFKLPRIILRQCGEMGLGFVKQNPSWMQRIRRVTARFPRLEARLRVFVQTRRRRDNAPTLNEIRWVVQPDPAALQAWQRLLRVTPKKPL
jgi:SAM-dependent methyltransferase